MWFRADPIASDFNSVSPSTSAALPDLVDVFGYRPSLLFFNRRFDYRRPVSLSNASCIVGLFFKDVLTSSMSSYSASCGE